MYNDVNIFRQTRKCDILCTNVQMNSKVAVLPIEDNLIIEIFTFCPSQLIPESESGCEKHHMLAATNPLCHPGLALPHAITHNLTPVFSSEEGGDQAPAFRGISFRDRIFRNPEIPGFFGTGSAKYFHPGNFGYSSGFFGILMQLVID